MFGDESVNPLSRISSNIRGGISEAKPDQSQDLKTDLAQIEPSNLALTTEIFKNLPSGLTVAVCSSALLTMDKRKQPQAKRHRTKEQITIWWLQGSRAQEGSGAVAAVKYKPAPRRSTGIGGINECGTPLGKPIPALYFLKPHSHTGSSSGPSLCCSGLSSGCPCRALTAALPAEPFGAAQRCGSSIAMVYYSCNSASNCWC